MTQTTEYSGIRILEAMHEAVRYSQTVHDLIRQAQPPAAKKIIEFGTGDGTFIRKFRRENVSVDGVETDARLRRQLEGEGYRMFTDIRDVESESCDFIYTINVLEHIPSLDAEVAQLRRALRSDGSLFVFVPAFEILWTSLDDEVGHVTRFTRSRLSASLRKAGFRVGRIEYFDSLGFPAALAVRLLEKLNMFRYEPGSVKFYDRHIFPVSRVLDGALRKVLGKNLVAVARRI